jgi:hypothetical protein
MRMKVWIESDDAVDPGNLVADEFGQRQQPADAENQRV